MLFYILKKYFSLFMNTPCHIVDIMLPSQMILRCIVGIVH